MQSDNPNPISASETITHSIIIGLITGLVDAVMIHFDIDGRAVFYLTPLLWFWVPLVWTTFCLAVGIVFLIPPIRRFSRSALIAAGPGLLLISRGGIPFKRAAHLSTMAAAIACLAAVAILVLLLSRIRLPNWLVLRPATTFLALAVLVVAVVTVGAVAANPTTRAATASEGDSQRVNVVLIFLDTIRYDDALKMSNLVNFESSSITFDNAWAPAPWTLPSHFAVLTGADASSVDFDARFRQFPDRGATLGQELARQGYTTAAVFANPLLNPRTGFARGFQSLNYSQSFDGCRSGLAFVLNSAAFHGFGVRTGLCSWMPASEVVEHATAVINSSKRPYFLALNFVDGHAPYHVESQCRENHEIRFTRSDWAAFGNASDTGSVIQPPVAKRVHAQYESALRCMDRSLGDLFEQLKRQPDYQRTIVAIVGDHGEQFGEHGFVGHGNSLYEQVLHVPLILKLPAVPARHVTKPVSISYLHDTLLEAAAVPQQSTHTLLSTDERPVWASIFPDNSAWSIIDRNYHVLRFADGRDEIYRYQTDPSEIKPLASVDDASIQGLSSALSYRQRLPTARDSRSQGLGYIQ